MAQEKGRLSFGQLITAFLYIEQTHGMYVLRRDCPIKYNYVYSLFVQTAKMEATTHKANIWHFTNFTVYLVPNHNQDVYLIPTKSLFMGSCGSGGRLVVHPSWGWVLRVPISKCRPFVNQCSWLFRVKISVSVHLVPKGLQFQHMPASVDGGMLTTNTYEMYERAGTNYLLGFKAGGCVL